MGTKNSCPLMSQKDGRQILQYIGPIYLVDQKLGFDPKGMSFIVTLQGGLIFSSHKHSPYWRT